MKVTHSIKKNSGFTLVELMVVVAILGVVVSLSAPDLRETIQNGRLTAQYNDLISAFRLARTESIKRQATTITLCASETSDLPAPECDSNNWEDGWIIFTDDNADRTIDAGADILIKRGEELTGGNTLRTAAGFISFAAGVPDASGTFTLCDDRGAEKAKAMAFSAVGQTRKTVDQDDTGFVNDHAGVDIICP